MPVQPGATVQLNKGSRPIEFDGDVRLGQSIAKAAKNGIGVADVGKIMKRIVDGFHGSEYAASERPYVLALWRTAARDADLQFGSRDVIHGNTDIKVNGKEIKFASKTAASEFLTEMAQWWGGLNKREKAQVTGNDRVGQQANEQIEGLSTKLKTAIKNYVGFIQESEALHPKYDSNKRGWVRGVTEKSLGQNMKRNSISTELKGAFDQGFTTLMGRARAGRVDEHAKRWGIVPRPDGGYRQMNRTITSFFTDADGNLQRRLGKTATAIMENINELAAMDLDKLHGNSELSEVAKVVLDVIWSRATVGSQSQRGRVSMSNLRDFWRGHRNEYPAAVEQFSYKLFTWARNRFANKIWNSAEQTWERLPRTTMCTDEKGKVFDGLMSMKSSAPLYKSMWKAAAALRAAQA